jgi:hypothetical protein
LPAVTDHVATEAPHDAGLKAQGWVVAVVLAAIIGVVCLLMAFSTTNTPHSIDGDSARYSKYVQSGE